jgi:vacuolar protein sorting-associated protein 13A/C
MFEKLLEKILGRIIGEYVEGISKNQIKVGILGGNVEIKNLTLKKNVIQQFNLPFDLKFGMIEHIKLKIPWTSI